VRANATVERLAAAQRPKRGPVVETRGAVLVAEDGHLVPVAPAPPQEFGAPHVERRSDQDAYAPAHDLVERRQQRLGPTGDERVDQNRVLAVTQRVRRHGRRDAVPLDGEAPESGSNLIERKHDSSIAWRLGRGSGMTDARATYTRLRSLIFGERSSLSQRPVSPSGCPRVGGVF
jgi:hypothetical protein